MSKASFWGRRGAAASVGRRKVGSKLAAAAAAAAARRADPHRCGQLQGCPTRFKHLSLRMEHIAVFQGVQTVHYKLARPQTCDGLPPPAGSGVRHQAKQTTLLQEHLLRHVAPLHEAETNQTIHKQRCAGSIHGSRNLGQLLAVRPTMRPLGPGQTRSCFAVASSHCVTAHHPAGALPYLKQDEADSPGDERHVLLAKGQHALAPPLPADTSVLAMRVDP